ncbi:hypothetical protein, partial [Brevibacterium pityocampae]|uniref:hypothetical protein n=1 Tax=Brevibacterium pityocampae TaxID=506594 RepID=UPI0031E55C4D
LNFRRDALAMLLILSHQEELSKNLDTPHFGHTAAVSREHYTDLGQVGPMLLEAQRRRTDSTH